jgi:hypothetical protein
VEEAVGSYEKARFGYSIYYGEEHDRVKDTNREIERLKKTLKRRCSQQ